MGKNRSRSEPPQKKTTISLAIDSNVLNVIKDESEIQGSSLNSRINSILEKYVTFYKSIEKLEPCIIAYNQFAKMVDLMDEKELTKIISVDGVSHALAALQHNGFPLTMESLIEGLFKRGLRYSGAYSSFNFYKDDEGYLCLVFDHKFGLKWSGVLAASHSRLIELALKLRTESRVLPYSVMLRVMDKDLVNTIAFD